MDSDYKSYAFQHLESWIHDSMSSGDATPKEIYDTIYKVVSENYYYHKEQVSRAYELLALLNGNGKGHIEDLKENSSPLPPQQNCIGWKSVGSGKYEKIFSKKDKSPECDDFWEQNIKEHGYEWTPIPSKDVPYPLYMNKNGDVCCPDYVVKKEDKVVKWQLPVEVDGLTGECYVNLPDDLLERAGLEEGDVVKWIDRGDGSFQLKKVND